MSPGAHLSHAARMAFDAQRALIVTVLHLEAAEIEADVVGIPELLDGLGDAATVLQQLADDYSHAAADRRLRA